LNYKLIALDVDGTLLTDDHRITEPTKRTIREIYEEGAKIVLCTGRGPTNTEPVMKELGFEGIMITHNGAATVESPSRSLLSIFSFPLEAVMPLIEYCREHRIQFDINTPFDLYTDFLHEGAAVMYKDFMVKPRILPDITTLSEAPVKFTLTGDIRVMDRAESRWSRLGDQLRLLRSGDRFIDIMNAEASKGNALRKLAEQWGIPREQILAIGNYNNDLEMIEYAGLGIAMGNSPDEVKRLADAETDSNNRDGVHKALQKYVLGRG